MTNNNYENRKQAKRQNYSSKEKYLKELEKRKANDDGKKGKSSEIALKEFLNPFSKIKDHVSKQNSYYGDILINGLKIEIKTSCGELGYIPIPYSNKEELEEVFDEFLLDKADLIAYAPEIDEDFKIETQFRILPKNDFIAMFFNYDGNGKIYRFKPLRQNENITVISLQSFHSKTRQKASKKIRNYIDNYLSSYPTAEEFVNNGYGF